MVLIRVDLPQPFGPRIATCSPAPMLSVISWSTCFSPSITVIRLKASRAGVSLSGFSSVFTVREYTSKHAKKRRDFLATTILLGRVRAIGFEFDYGQRLHERYSAAGPGGFRCERPIGHQHWSRRHSHG